ncbi:MAG TPA: hypothetical protein VFF65_02275 [Phycisphaerales bacterium]|nr:hypothetical protein [Phycisphaerales bacterium]
MNTQRNSQSRTSVAEMVRAYIEALVSPQPRGDTAAGGAFARGMAFCPVQVQAQPRPVPARATRAGRMPLR